MKRVIGVAHTICLAPIRFFLEATKVFPVMFLALMFVVPVCLYAIIMFHFALMPYHIFKLILFLASGLNYLATYNHPREKAIRGIIKRLESEAYKYCHVRVKVRLKAGLESGAHICGHKITYNKQLFCTSRYGELRFILFHEIGHMKLGHKDSRRRLDYELEADEYSLLITKQREYALSTLSKLLQLTGDPELQMRLARI